MKNGYMERILDIDLGSGKIETIDFPEDIKKQYIGGSGLAAWYLNAGGCAGTPIDNRSIGESPDCTLASRRCHRRS